MAQAETVAIPKRLPLVIEPENRGDSVDYDSRLVNCFIERKGEGEGAQYWLFQRPGLDESSRPPMANAVGRGVFNWKGDIYSIFGDTLYKNGGALSPAIDTTNGVYRFDSVLGATPKLVLGNGVEGYYYDDGGGLVNISDGDFPAAFRKGWAYLDGTLYVLVSTAHIQGSDINDPAAWNPLNSILAQVEPDQGVALGKQLVYVVALKQWSAEVFYDAGNASGSPLGAVQGAKMNFGCAHQDSVQDVNGVLLWLSATEEAGLQVVAVDALKISVVSTPAVERLLRNADLTTVYSWQIKVGGHRFYILTIVEENLTLAYDLTDRFWHQWTDTDGNYFPIVASTYNSSRQAILQHESNGRLYTASMDYATDDGDVVQIDIYTPNFDGGTRRRKQMNMLKIVGDQQPGSILQVRVNDFDYNPKHWTNFRTFNMAQKDPWIDNCGTFVRRIHNFRHRCAVRMPRIQAVEMQIDLGTL